MDWRKFCIGVLCFCILNNGMNGALIPVIMGVAPLLLGTMTFLTTPRNTMGDVLTLAPEGQHSFAVVDDTLPNSGGLLNSFADGMMGDLISSVLAPNDPPYNGPGSVIMNVADQVRGIGLNVLRTWVQVFVNVSDLIRFLMLVGLRGANTVIANTMRALIQRAFTGRGNRPSLFKRPSSGGPQRLINALQTGAIIAQAVRNALNRGRGILGKLGGGGGGPMKQLLNTIGKGIVTSMADALRFRIQEFRFNLRQVPRDIINALRGARTSAQNRANMLRSIAGRVKDAFSRLRNGLLGSLVRLPIKIIKDIVNRGKGLVKNAVGNLINNMRPSLLKRLLQPGPVRQALGKGRDFLKSILSPVKKVISAVRNIAKNMRERLAQTLKMAAIAFVVSRAKLPTKSIPKPFQRIANLASKLRGAGRNLLDSLKRVFGGGVFGVVRRAIGEAGKKIKDKLPLPRNILKNALVRLANRKGLFPRLRELPLKALDVLSIVSNLRARSRAIRAETRRDLLQIRQGMRSIMRSLVSSFGSQSRMIAMVLGLLGSFRDRRPSFVKAVTNVLNTLTAILRGGGQNGIIARIMERLKELNYVLQPFLTIG